MNDEYFFVEMFFYCEVASLLKHNGAAGASNPLTLAILPDDTT